MSAARSSTGELLVRYHDLCDLAFSPGGHEVACAADPSVHEDVVVEKVARFGLLASLVLGGHLTLHASAIEVGGRALVFAGGSKSGKSTLAGLGCQLGARLVTDSVLRIDSAGSCFTGPFELRLRPPADALDLRHVTITRQVAPDARVALTLPQPDADEVGLAGIVLPRLDRDARALVVEELHGSRAVVALTPTLRHWFCRDVSLNAHFLAELATLVKNVPVWRCAVPLSPPLHPGYLGELFDLVGLRR